MYQCSYDGLAKGTSTDRRYFTGYFTKAEKHLRKIKNKHKAAQLLQPDLCCSKSHVFITYLKTAH